MAVVGSLLDQAMEGLAKACYRGDASAGFKFDQLIALQVATK
jgi:hypothetical protein